MTTFRRLSNESKYQAVVFYCEIMEIDVDLFYNRIVDWFIKTNRLFHLDGRMVKDLPSNFK